MSQTAKVYLTCIGMLLLSLAASFLLSALSGSVTISILLRIVISEFCIVFPAMLFMKFARRGKRKMIPQRKIGWKEILCLIGMVFTVIPVLSFLNYVSSLLAGSGTDSLMESISVYPKGIAVLFVAVLPAFAEEFAFRGVIYHGLRKHGFVKAVLISALLFGLFHMNWNQFSYAFVLGILLAVVTEITGNLFAPVLIHFGINYLSTSALYALGDLTEETEAASNVTSMAGVELLYVSLLFIMASVGIFLTILLTGLLAKAAERPGYMEWLLSGGEKKYLSEMEKEKCINGWFFPAVLIPLVIMIIEA